MKMDGPDVFCLNWQRSTVSTGMVWSPDPVLYMFLVIRSLSIYGTKRWVTT